MNTTTNSGGFVEHRGVTANSAAGTVLLEQDAQVAHGAMMDVEPVP